jgi:digeranylgeranylglycerophospholipid reductase
MKYDAIVVGAGPAGLVGARTIASKGFKVIIVEKERRLGVKPCGEACSAPTLEDSLVDPNGDFVAQKIKGALIYPPNKKSISVVGEAGVGCILNKSLFLQHLASKAIEAGADILMGSQVVSLERNEGIVKAKTQETELEAKLVLGADGFTSTVAKSFGLEKTGNREVIPCMQYLMVNCTFRDEQTAEFYLGREVAPSGYAWAFPKGEGKANVGVGVRGSPAKPYLEKFIEGNPDMFSKAKVIGIEGAPVTIGGMLDQIVDDNVMLVGEAAGQVIPLTGAGIHSGVVGAKMAAQTAIDALEKGDFSKDMLMSYSENYSEHWGKRISDSLKALRMIEQLNDDDLNMLAEMLDSSDILDLANGLDIGRVARRFLRHPIFGLKVARMLAKS